jgi:hypothetical protein
MAEGSSAVIGEIIKAFAAIVGAGISGYVAYQIGMHDGKGTGPVEPVNTVENVSTPLTERNEASPDTGEDALSAATALQAADEKIAELLKQLAIAKERAAAKPISLDDLNVRTGAFNSDVARTADDCVRDVKSYFAGRDIALSGNQLEWRYSDGEARVSLECYSDGHIVIVAYGFDPAGTIAAKNRARAFVADIPNY